MAGILVERGISEALDRAHANPHFHLGQAPHSQIVIPSPFTTVFQRCVNANNALDLAIQSLREKDIRGMNIHEFANTERDVFRIYAYAMHLTKKHKKELTPEQRAQLIEKAQILKLGAKISHSFYQNSEFKKFIDKNHLHHGCFQVRLQLNATREGVPLIPYVIDGVSHEIAWDQLSKEALEGGGYAFKTSGGHTVFEVNEESELLPSYAFNYQGFHRYNILRTSHLLPVKERQRIPGDAEFCIDVITATSKSQGAGIGGCSQQHSYLAMYNPTHEFSFGKYANFRDLTDLQKGCVTGIKDGEIHSPDEYSFMPRSQFNITRTRLIISETQFNRLKERFMKDKREPDHPFSVLKRNCTAYVCDVLAKELDIRVEATLPAGHYMYYYMPNFVRSPMEFVYNNVFKKLPTLLQDAISLVCKPFYYLYCVGVGLFAKSLSMINHEKFFYEFDITWKEIFANEVVVKHPTRLRHDLRLQFPRGWSDISERG